MSQENVDVIRKVWDAYSHGDYHRIKGFCDPHCVLITLDEGAQYGWDAVSAGYERWHEAWEAETTTVEEVIGHGDRVFAAGRFHARGRASGVAVETRHYEVYTMRDGTILRIDEFREREEALEAAGLRE
jgi:ketosteroid isomerase-like protein